MFLPKGYLSFRTAAFVYDDDSKNEIIPIGERLGGALAIGELIAHGIVVASVAYDDDPPEMGEILQLRPEIWRGPRARDAVIGPNATERLIQDGLILVPAIQEAALDAWFKGENKGHQSVIENASYRSVSVPGLSLGVHAVPQGYITFDQISRIARVWAKDGKIDPDLIPLLDPSDTDSMTQALATGSLRAFGISKRTGAIVPLPPSVWRMEVSGAPQSIWAIGGNDILAGPDGESCLPVITRADLARCFQATEIPPDPNELPEGSQAAVPFARRNSDGCGDIAIDSWMRGLAQGHKNLGKILKRKDAIEAAVLHLHSTTRQAEAAFEALPFPDLRNPPRTPAT